MKYSINSQTVPRAYGFASRGTTAGRLIFISGTIACADRQCTHLIEGDMRDQTERIIDIIEGSLKEVGLTLSDVCQTTVYLSNINDSSVIDEVYERRFGKPAPARSLVEVKKLPLFALVEIDAIALR